MRNATRLAGLWLMLSLPALPAGRAGQPEERAAQAAAILRSHCGRCHGPGGTGKGGFDYLLDRERLVAASLLVPGKADASPLLQRIEVGEMPPAKQPRLRPEEVTAIRQWIAAGAPAAQKPSTQPALGEAEALRLVLADLERMSPRQRRFCRYVSLAHLHAAGLPDEDVERHRQALAKLVNSLSWHPRLTVPLAIDPGRTVFRIDLRAYRWTASAWERLVSLYPYRADPVGPALQRCSVLTGSAQPVVHGDWLIATASRPPCYHDLLQLPSTDRALERMLQVEVRADLEEDNALRAGFNGSGVSRNNRILERHDALHGAYWRSHDFQANTGRENIFEHPLGPSAGGNGFVPAGGEILFHLPNGLLGYLLVNGLGQRVDQAPGEIVSDPSRPDRRVENGVSCMGCHVRGLIPRDDQVRAHVLKNAHAFTESDRAAALALYVPAATWRRRMQEDQDRFLRALAEMGVPAREPEPIGASVRQYEAALDLARAAAETGRAPKVLAEHLRSSPRLMRTLGPLLTPGGIVQRQVFEDAFRELRQTLPAVPEAAPLVQQRDPSPFVGHQGVLRDLAFAPDGRALAAAGEDRRVRVWNVRDGSLAHCLEGHGDEVLCLAFRADGRLLVSGSRDRTLCAWDLATGKQVQRLVGHTDDVRAVAVSGDGRWALSGGGDHTLRLWDLAAGKERYCLVGHTGAVSCVAISADGRLGLSGSTRGELRLWDLEQGRAKGVWQSSGGAIYSVAFRGDGRQALSGGNDRLLRVWDVVSGREIRRLSGHVNAIVRVAYSGDGRHACSGSSRYRSADPILRVWDLDRGTQEPVLTGEDAEGTVCLALAPDGKRAALGLADGALRVELLPDGTNRVRGQQR